MRGRGLCGPLHFGVACIGAAKPDVLRSGRRKDDRVLRDQRDGGAEFRAGQVAQIDTIQCDTA